MNIEEFDKLAKKRVVYTIDDMERVFVKRNITYKTVGDTTLRMDVYYPLDIKEGMIRPAVLFVHGGGPLERVEQGKDMQSFVSWGQLTAESGLIAVTFSHRQLWTLTKLEDARSDIDDCIVYILVHGMSLGIDINALCIWSCSSGTLHSLRKMLREAPAYIRCSVVYYGLLSLMNKKYYTYTLDEEAEIKEFSALHHLRETDKTIAPIFIARAGLDNDYLPERFFEVQLIFARKVAEVTGRSFEDAVLHNTAMYRILGLDWSADPTHPTWQAYVQALQSDKDSGARGTYRFYYARSDSIPRQSDLPHYGCFAYEYLPDQHRIKIHFSNQDYTEYGALSHQRMAIRKIELKNMFTHIHNEHPEAETVIGSSWLYNLDAYKRLFPVEYGQSAKEADRVYYTGRGLWGQFLDHEWLVNERTAAIFLQRVDAATNIQECDHCFPYQLLFPKALIALFYEFYDIR